MNKVILLGRLTRDPETKVTSGGHVVGRMTLAVNRPRRKDRPSEAPEADFIPLVVWNKQADFAKRWLMKGSPILVEGRLQVRTYTDDQGIKRYLTEVVVREINFAGSNPNRQHQAAASAYEPPTMEPMLPMEAVEPTPMDMFGEPDYEDAPY